MTSRYFLATYRPLINTVHGRRAVDFYGQAPFVDGSCRREPDFEAGYPAITALCRSGNFAPRLRPDDRVIFLTKKGKYLDDRIKGWRLVSILKVIERFEDHGKAAEWYRRRRLSLPNNCLVGGNDPVRCELTHGHPKAEIRRRGRGDAEGTIRLWDAVYQQRTTRWPIILVCESLYLDLHTPIQIDESDFHHIFGRVPGTRNPPQITRDEFNKLARLARAS